jgi:hypothetical protein
MPLHSFFPLIFANKISPSPLHEGCRILQIISLVREAKGRIAEIGITDDKPMNLHKD